MNHVPEFEHKLSQMILNINTMTLERELLWAFHRQDDDDDNEGLWILYSVRRSKVKKFDHKLLSSFIHGYDDEFEASGVELLGDMNYSEYSAI